jgi:adenylate cyclase
MACSWAIDRPSGFAPEEIALFDRLMPVLAITSQAISIAATARILLRTYLGVDAADRVLKGNIIRGRAETIHAVIWYSDLAGFTRLTDKVSRAGMLQLFSGHAEILGLLNDYAEILVDAIEARGGQVLKFMGDGILAIFRADSDEDACEAALSAWTQASGLCGELGRRRVADGVAETHPYLALHAGEVLYGNIGGRARLDFTVLGPAVNEASRIAALCRSLDQPAILSEAFAAACPAARRERLVRLGRYALRGVAEPQMLFTPEPSNGT